MKASELRQSILQAAVQGKLVPQNSLDDPASELLGKIRAKKNNLIKQGKLKKEKSIPLIDDDELPFAIPNGWATCRLNELVSKIGSGSTPTGGRNVYVPSGVKFLRSQNVYNHGLMLQDVVYITNAIHRKMNNTAVQPKDILLNITGASIGRSCIVDDDFDTGNVNQHVSIIRCIIPSIRYFIHLFLISPCLQQEIMAQQVGMSREGLSGEKIKKFIIPLPPLAEQKRIIAKVNDLMMMCDELEKSENELNKLNEHFIEYLPKSILQMAVQGKLVSQNLDDEPAATLLDHIHSEKTKLVKQKIIKKDKSLPPLTEGKRPFDLPEGWVWCRLYDVCEYIQRGKSPIYSDEKKIPVLSQKCVQWSGLDVTRMRYISPESLADYAAERFLQDGDILWNSTGQGTLGRVAIYHSLGKFQNVVTDSHITVVRPMKRYVIPEYVYLCLRSPFVQNDIERKSTGTTKQIELGLETIKSHLFPLPPLTEQQRIVKKVKSLMALCEELREMDYSGSAKSSTITMPIQQASEQENDFAIAARGNMNQAFSPKLQGAINKWRKGKSRG